MKKVCVMMLAALLALGAFVQAGSASELGQMKAALAAMQAANGGAAEGMLESLTEEQNLGGATPRSGAYTDYLQRMSANAVMRVGSEGEGVRRLQLNLHALGYYFGSISGIYGNITREAVCRFQQDYGLSVDGVAGPATLSKINEVINAWMNAPADTAYAGSGAAELEQVQMSATGVGRYSISGTLSVDVTLRRGSSSGHVSKLQNALGVLGYFNDEVTGYFGAVTEASVIAFQNAKGLTADGIAGRNTLTAINTELNNRLQSSSL